MLLAACARNASTTAWTGQDPHHLPPERIGESPAVAPDPPPVREGPRPVRIDPAEEAFVDSVLALMTLPEKLGQLNQVAGRWGPGGVIVDTLEERRVRTGQVGSFLSVYGANATRRLQRVAVEESRMRIPILFAHDVIHGFRTVFPVPLAEAASWDPALVRENARIAAAEATAYGIHWTFAPMVDVARDPRWGRIVEGAGEDPYLGSAMAAARVRGFQGADLRAPLSIAATAKHFAAYGAAEGGRDYNIADVSDRTLRETYLPPFRAAVCAGTQTLMASFNEIGGVPAHGSRALLTDVLREEWGFRGLVVSDWAGVQEMMPHGVAGTRGAAARIGLHAGVDIDMVSEVFRKNLPAEIEAGRVPMDELDEAVRRVLRLKYRLGLFANPYSRGDAAREPAVGALPAVHRRAAREAAARSMVLLKNDGAVLPFDRARIRRIAVVGPLATDRHSPMGSWAGAGRDDEVVTVLDGIRAAAGRGIEVIHAPGVENVLSTERGGFTPAERAARRADAVVLVVGETENMSGEASSRAYLDLPGAQRELVDAVRRAAGNKPLAVVLMNGRPLAIEWMHQSVPAILEGWFGGVEMGSAVGDVLFGDVNPAGKLPVTFPRTIGQIPIYYSHRQTGRPAHPLNEYTSKYEDAPWTPLYPFGHGLSYTWFRYGPMRLSAIRITPADSLTVTVDVTNAGPRAGDEVVQLYVQDRVASMTRPVKELRGFQRIRLNAGETRTVTFRLDVDDLAFWGPGLRRIAEPGAFVVEVGTSSDRVQGSEFLLTTADGQPVSVPERCEAA
ncbi:MAG TPA: glycoside hydrolase family 3 N-terminal domain-containing protein [Longimicrobium sp.]|nr:glycoside hydrolase family 3 N-terminal domain-containing protein [Longimicrobium sp.]